MAKKFYALRDSKAEYYNAPALAMNQYEATRGLQQMLQQQKESQIAMFPHDFDLYELGEFDEQTGKIAAYDAPKHIIKAAELTQLG